MGPFEAELEWSEEGISGTYRFLKRVWSVVLETSEVKSSAVDDDFVAKLRYNTVRTVKKVTEDMDSFAFNTAVAALMEFVNFLSSNREKAGSSGHLWNDSIRKLLVLIAPMTPFISDELWERLNFPGDTVFRQEWPSWDENDLILNTVEMVVQVKGKIRGRITINTDAGNDEIEMEALSLLKIKEILGGRKPGRVIVVPGKLVNIIP
jgi:leucyl-tRNA synthetase